MTLYLDLQFIHTVRITWFPHPRTSTSNAQHLETKYLHIGVFARRDPVIYLTLTMHFRKSL